jgi:hypothetical protein
MGAKTAAYVTTWTIIARGEGRVEDCWSRKTVWIAGAKYAATTI